LGFQPQINSQVITEKELISRMSMIIPKFNLTIYKKSLNSKQINAILLRWGYIYKNEKGDYAKYIIDQFDFNGDGRLNPREFILFTIVKNKFINGKGTCKNCYEEIIKEIVDPIFNFLDCGSNDELTTEEICNGFSYLNRNIPDKYDMFACKINSKMVRTTSCNDLILKNASRYGYLDKIEFRKSILLGYWDRQVRRVHVTPNDKRNKKSFRWSSDGKIDLFCEKLNMFDSM
jgi:hypothetical protein